MATIGQRIVWQHIDGIMPSSRAEPELPAEDRLFMIDISIFLVLSY